MHYRTYIGYGMVSIIGTLMTACHACMRACAYVHMPPMLPLGVTWHALYLYVVGYIMTSLLGCHIYPQIGYNVEIQNV